MSGTAALLKRVATLALFLGEMWESLLMMNLTIKILWMERIVEFTKKIEIYLKKLVQLLKDVLACSILAEFPLTFPLLHFLLLGIRLTFKFRR